MIWEMIFFSLAVAAVTGISLGFRLHSEDSLESNQVHFQLLQALFQRRMLAATAAAAVIGHGRHAKTMMD